MLAVLVEITSIERIGRVRDIGLAASESRRHHSILSSLLTRQRRRLSLLSETLMLLALAQLVDQLWLVQNCVC